MRIFIVEDNENIREAVAGYLRLEGLDVEEFEGVKPARRALDSAGSNLPDLMVLDVMLPDGDGFMFAKQIRKDEKTSFAEIPIIFLTARDQESDRITGLELGADDYVVKPFSTRELVLRVKAVLKRTGIDEKAESRDDKIYQHGEEQLVISTIKHQIFLNTKSIMFTAAEWNILVFLAERAPQVFSRLQLLEYCLDSIAEGSERTIDTHVKNIRHKLGGTDWIETVRGFGYRFSGDRL